MLLRLLGWLLKDSKREREIDRNCAIAQAALIEPVYEEGLPSTFLVSIDGELNANEVSAFVSLIDKRIYEMCSKDSERYEHQRMRAEIAIKPLSWEAKRVVVTQDHQNKPKLVMQWIPKEPHFNVRLDDD